MFWERGWEREQWSRDVGEYEMNGGYRQSKQRWWVLRSSQKKAQ